MHRLPIIIEEELLHQQAPVPVLTLQTGLRTMIPEVSRLCKGVIPAQVQNIKAARTGLIRQAIVIQEQVQVQDRRIITAEQVRVQVLHTKALRQIQVIPNIRLLQDVLQEEVIRLRVRPADLLHILRAQGLQVQVARIRQAPQVHQALLHVRVQADLHHQEVEGKI